MSKVTLAIAGVPNTTVTMYNNEVEDGNIQASIDAGNTGSHEKAEIQVAKKRLASDGEHIKDENHLNKRPVFKSHTDGAVLFPVDHV